MSLLSFSVSRPLPSLLLFPYTTLFRSCRLSPPEIRTALSLWGGPRGIGQIPWSLGTLGRGDWALTAPDHLDRLRHVVRSEEHTSELQSPCNIVCRHLLEKKQVCTYSLA